MLLLSTDMVLNSKFKLLSVRDLLESIPSAKREWKWKTPMEKWCYLYSIGKLACDLMHVAVFQEDVTNIHWFGYFIFVDVSTVIIFSLYTVYCHIGEGDIASSLPSTCLGVLVTGVRCSLYYYIFNLLVHSLQWSANYTIPI